jgi:hypothetical protein
VSSDAIATNVNGSVALTPKSRLRKSRVNREAVDTGVAQLLRPFLVNCQKFHTATIEIAMQIELDK